MSFALPTAFLLVAIALPIVGLYILKVRLRRVPVSTNLFWHQIFDEKPPRSIWQNLRHLVSLLMQLALLLLLVLALADPYFAWQAKYARHVVLVIDNSASMQAVDVAPTRFDAAISRAQELVTGLRDQDQVAIVLAGKSPEVIVGMTGHIPTLRRAIDRIEISDATTHLDRAVELGQQLVAPYERGEVIVLTDGCQGRIESPAEQAAKVADTEEKTSDEESTEEKPASKVAWEIFGTEANNVGITQFQTRRSLIDPLGYEILASVSNASAEPVKARLEIMLDDVPVDILPLKLEPGEHWKRALEKTSIEGGTLEARLTKISRNVEGEEAEDGDDAELNGLTIDDVAYALLPRQERQSVLLVTPGYFFLEKVFEANPMVDLTVLEEFPETWPTGSVIVLHRNTPEELPSGNVWVIDPENDTDLWTVKGTLENPIVTKQAEDSPLMTHISLDNVLLPKASQVEWKSKVLSLAETVSGDSIYAEIDRPAGKVLVLPVNLESSDLAFRTAFPIMATNALSWFAGPSGELHPSISTDQMEKVELSEETLTQHPTLAMVSPTGTNKPQPVMPATKTQDGETTSPPATTVGPLPSVGIWRLIPEKEEADTSTDDAAEVEPIREFAVNLANERETDLRPPTALLEQTNPATAVSGWWNRPPWFLLVCLACVFTAWEWFAYQRRVIT